MYAVSDAYKIAMKKPVQRFRMTGTVSSMPFNDDNILKGSFSITNQCCDDTEMKIGQVYVGELNVTLIGISLERYTLMHKTIKPKFGRMLETGVYEDIPLGVFNISEAEWTTSGIVVKAYDNMSKLDRSCTIKSANGEPYRLALMACKACDVELATTSAEFTHFANGFETLSMVTDNDIETWRDFISWVAQTCACFVTCDREGRIVFRSYGKEIVDRIEPQHRFAGGSFSDYETRYTGISVVNIAEKTTSYYGMETDNALTYNLGSNPFIQIGVEEAVEDMRRAILNALQNISYVPFKIQMIGDPVYDLGDVFQFANGIADETKLFCLTKYTFNYNGAYEMQGVGKNPALSNAKSKTDKNIAGLMNQKEEDKIHFTVFTNVDDVTVADQESKSVMYMRFIVAKTTHVAIDMEFLLTVETTESDSDINWIENDAVVTVTYYIDGEEVELRHPVETWQDGKHILHLRYDLQAVEANIHTWDVWFTMNGGSVYIEPYAVHCVAMGQGLTAESEWDGTIQAFDDIERFSVGIPFREIKDSAEVTGIISRCSLPVDRIAPFDFLGMFKGITDKISATEDVMVFTPWVNHDKVTTDCLTDSEVGWIGAGTAKLGDARILTTVEIRNVKRVETQSSNAVFYASFDSGVTWVGWTEEGWVENASMIKTEIEAVSPVAWAQGGDSVRLRAVLEQDSSLFTLNVYGGQYYD